MKMCFTKWMVAVSFIALIGVLSVPVKAEDFTIPESDLGDVIGHVYASDILATVNGVPIPSYNIGDKTAIAVEDLRYYGFEVSQGSGIRNPGVDDETMYWCSVTLQEGDAIISGVPAARMDVGATLGEVIDNIYAADVILGFIEFRSLPCFVINNRVCAAIEDLSLYLPLISHQWDDVNRVIELTLHKPVVQRVNLAEIIGQPFDDVGILLGNAIIVRSSWSYINNRFTQNYIDIRNIRFDTAIAVNTTTLDNTVPEYIERISIEYAQEGEVGSYLVTLDSFSGFEASRRFHFNGLDYTSTRDDVKKMFSNADFRQTYVRNLTVFGTGDPRTWERTYNYTKVSVLPHSAETALIEKYDNMIYWNNEFAITFDFDSDGRVIGFTILSNVMK